MKRKNITKSRRQFLRKSCMATLSLAVGAEIVFAKNLPKGMLPIVLTNRKQPISLPGKHADLIILNDLFVRKKCSIL